MQVESRLVPILRDGVQIVKMVLFQKLKQRLPEKYPDRNPADISRLSGAVINEIFGTPNQAEPFLSFTTENRKWIRKEIDAIATDMEEMRIPLTDALRIQFLCDHQEGIESADILKQAQQAGILIPDRDIPLPKHFLNLVRQMGKRFNLLQPTATGEAHC